jgi:mannose-6-phosphate isomerase-like protein (cupin superfamily)
MTVRRVVTGEVDGRSRVVSDSAAPDTLWCTEVWTTSAAQPYGADPGDETRPLNPPAGSTAWRVATVPPDAGPRAPLPAGAMKAIGEVGADGFHMTSTVDFVFILDGPVELVLDDGAVSLQPGDCVVQRGTNHAWRNHGDTPIRLLSVMISTA